jgi:hypothetical protein
MSGNRWTLSLRDKRRTRRYGNATIFLSIHSKLILFSTHTALFVQSLNAPRYSAAQQWDHTPQSNELPHLQFASDILAGYWLRTPNPKNLEYYFANNVVNEETLPLINKVLGDRGHDKIPAWPGVRVSGPSEEGAVLLGMFMSFQCLSFHVSPNHESPSVGGRDGIQQAAASPFSVTSSRLDTSVTLLLAKFYNRLSHWLKPRFPSPPT